MANNKYTGEVGLEIGSIDGVLLFDWAALSKIKTTFGAMVDVIVNDSPSPDTLAEILAIGFESKSPEITKDVIMKASPSLNKVLEALDKAITYAYFGADGMEEIEKAIAKVNEAVANAEDTKKKTR